MFKKILTLIKKHKIISIIVVVVIVGSIIIVVQATKGKAAETRYVLSTVEKGTLSTTISGSGQVSASDQVDIKAKASGEVVKLSVKNGQEVKAGTVLATLGATDAYESVRDAKDNLESAKLSLEKLKNPADEHEIFQGETALTNAQNDLEKLKLSQQIDHDKAIEAKAKAAENLADAYEDVYNTIAKTFLEIPEVMTGMNDIVLSHEIVESEPVFGSAYTNGQALINSVRPSDATEYGEMGIFVEGATNLFNTTDDFYDKTFDEYKSISRSSDPAKIEELLEKTTDMVKDISDTAKSELNMIDYWIDYRDTKDLTLFKVVTDYKTDLINYTNTINSNLSALVSIDKTIKESKQTIIDEDRSLQEMELNNPLALAAAERAVIEKQMSLDDLKKGTDSLDIRSAEITLRQRQATVAKALQTLSDYSIKAPFDGVVASVEIKKGESLSSGATVATLITKQKIAEIPLNEVDVAKVMVGQKVTLTFDAISDLSLSGEVAEVDTLGTVNQGVVSYNVVIVFDTQDERVKPGMSVSATIITEIKQDVLLVPASAVKTQGDMSYVEVVESESGAVDTQASTGVVLATPPRQQIVEVGITNDTSVEIISGLTEGEKIVSRTITATAAKTSANTQSAPSLFGNTGASTRGSFGRAAPISR